MMGHAEMMGEKRGHPGVAEMSDEQRADYAALQAGAEDDSLQLPVAEGPDLGGELAGLILMVSKMAEPAFPSLGKIYTEQTAGAVGGAVAGLCNKYGWLQGGVSSEYREEMLAAAILLPIGFATYRGIKGDIAAMKKPDTVTEAQAEKKGVTVGEQLSAMRAEMAASSTGSKTVSFGTVAANG